MHSTTRSLITEKAATRAADYYNEHPGHYAYAMTYCERVAARRQDANADDVAALAAVIVPSFVRQGLETDMGAIRSAVRRAVDRAAKAVARAEKARTTLADGSSASTIPWDVAEDETRTHLITDAPNPAKAYDVKAHDYIDQALEHVEQDADRKALSAAVEAVRKERQRTLTTRQTPRTAQRRIAAATSELETLKARILADPYGDGTGNRTRQAHPEHTYARPKAHTPKEDRPAQMPHWAMPGGTARPQVGACVAVRMIDTGTPGTELLRLTVTAPNGDTWARTYTSPDAWTNDDTRRLSAALADTAAVEAMSREERADVARLAAAQAGAPKQPSPRSRNRVGNTGPTVPAWR